MKKAKRVIKLPPQAMEALIEQRRLFVEKFGRQPGPDDPVFFDPDASEPTPIDLGEIKRGIADAAKRCGINPERALRHFGF